MTMNTMPGKRSRADMQGAFEGMHASEDMYEKVMARASHRGRKRGGAPKIAVVATVALAAALAARRTRSLAGTSSSADGATTDMVR